MVLGAAACSGGGDSQSTVKSLEVCKAPGDSDEVVKTKALTAFFEAREGDTITFCEGRFQMPTGLILNGKRGITIKGAGRDQTILNFKGSDSAEGINATHADGLIIEGLTIEDTPGNAIRVFRSEQVVLRDVRTRWRDSDGRDETQEGYAPSEENGAYGLYPVEARHVLMEDCESHGASDAGIYVGQTSDVIVRNCLATYNVAGFEFENTFRAVFEDNIATNNTGGFLVFDLPGLRQYGAKNVVRRNKTFANNTDNFAPVGNIVGLTPRGTGMLILATDQLEIHDNEIYDNDTVGIAIVNYGLADPNNTDARYDFFPEGLHIHNNVFRNNGGNPQNPDLQRDVATVLPLLLRLKNLGRSAHIVWDGAEDAPNDCTSVPTDADGVPLTEPNPNRPHEEQGGRTDERGRPNIIREDRDPECRYTAWKFDETGALKQPDNGLCIEDNNEFVNGSGLLSALTTPYLRANITTSDPAGLVIDLLRPVSSSPPRCVLPPRPAPTLKLPYVPHASADTRPSAAETAAACGKALAPGQINAEALARFDCPRLDQYGLFANAEDPRSAPNGGGVPYDLNSALFSDYSVKYRVLFIPAGQTATYKDHNDGSSATLDFPMGTVIAKSFAFRKDDAMGVALSENVIETRLLIKRQTAGGVSWVGLPYVWTTQNGRRIAELKVAGATAAVEYDYLDPDPEVKNADGTRTRYTGSVAAYGVPAALNCLTCHAADDREPGSAPIGPKPRFLNRDYDYGTGIGTMNQLAFLKMQGLLAGLPADMASVERSPKWNVPGSSGELADQPADVHARVRAYLEVNCAHCHNPNGAGSNSGLFLDAYRAVDVRYGICKKPVAAGRGSGGFSFDIVPGTAEESILYFRVANDQPGIRMPPVARTVVHGEAVSLIARWIDEALPALSAEIDNEEACTGTGLPGLSGLSALAVPAELAPLLRAAGLLSPDQRRIVESAAPKR